MIPRDSDRKHAAHLPRKTGSAVPRTQRKQAAILRRLAGRPLRPCLAVRRAATNESTSSARLEPPESSAGWPTTAFSGSWARVAWALSSWPKTVFSPGPSP